MPPGLISERGRDRIYGYLLIYIADAAAAIISCYYGTADGAGALGDRSTRIYLADAAAAITGCYYGAADGAGALGDRKIPSMARAQNAAYPRLSQRMHGNASCQLV